MLRKRIALGFLLCVFLFLGLFQPLMVQAAEVEQVQIQVAGLV